LDGRSAKTVKKNENVLAPILTALGSRRLRELTADDVHRALTAMAARWPGSVHHPTRQDQQLASAAVRFDPR
jgi:hypothetical protein